MAKNKLKFIFILMPVLFFIAGCSLVETPKTDGEKITNFAECAKKYPVMESYPRQCNTPDGGHFVEELTPDDNTEPEPPIVGGDKDEHGCIGSAGYSWCELKNKCLRIWEEPCLPDQEVKAVKEYLEKNISIISPQKEVLGGKFYITNIRFNKAGEAVVNYEDGHIALQATAKYQYQNGQVKIEEFIVEPIEEPGTVKSDGPSGGAEDNSGGATGGGQACTGEAKLCPDGSYAERTGPNCEFAPCPGE